MVMRKALLILLTVILLLAPVQVGCGANVISRLSIPSREPGYSRFESTFIVSQNDLDDFISDIERQDGWNHKNVFLELVPTWRMDFSTHNLFLYRHVEGSGGTFVTVGEPSVNGNTVTIDVSRPTLGDTDDEAYYGFAYKISKNITNMTFVLEGRDDVSFQFSDGEIVVEN